MASVTIELDGNELWSAVFGSGFESDPVNRHWLKDYSFGKDTTWNKAGIVTIEYITEADENIVHTRDLDVNDLAQALSYAIQNGYRHVPCGGAIGIDFDDYDSCVADIILQLAIYGKEVFA